MRAVVLGSALLVTAVLAFLTMLVLFESGPDILTIVSLGVLALFVFGIFGALTTPPDRRK